MQTLSEQVFSSCCHGQGAVLDTAGDKLLGGFSFGTLLWTKQKKVRNL
jgi:hypothetical protein